MESFYVSMRVFPIVKPFKVWGVVGIKVSDERIITCVCQDRLLNAPQISFLIEMVFDNIEDAKAVIASVEDSKERRIVFSKNNMDAVFTVHPAVTFRANN